MQIVKNKYISQYDKDAVVRIAKAVKQYLANKTIHILE